MSLILDALRKSEAERRRGQAPDLYSRAPSLPIRPTAPWRAIATGAVIIVPVIVIALWAWRSHTADEREGALQVPHASAMAEPPPAREVAAPEPRPAPPPTAPPQPVSSTPAASSSPVDSPAPADITPPPVVAPSPPAALAPAAPAMAPPPVETPPQDDVAPIAVLSAAERTSLPPLKLSMHVWNSDPARRFAIVDGQRIAEGTLIGSAVVAEIRRDGVVLDINGRRLLLSRP